MAVTLGSMLPGVSHSRVAIVIPGRRLKMLCHNIFPADRHERSSLSTRPERRSVTDAFRYASHSPRRVGVDATIRKQSDV
jgi:hypothetical protein